MGLKAKKKNRAIRHGKWETQDVGIQESALSNAEALVDAIDGKEIDKKYRDGWDDDIVGNGSQNHPLLGAACEFWYQRTRNVVKANEVLDAWLEYSHLHFMTSETYSSFIYGQWIHGSILTVAFGAKLMGRTDVSDRLYGILRTGYSLWALGCSGDQWNGSHPGKAVAWAGSRSWITKKVDDNYYDDNGVLREPYNVDTTFATNLLAAALGWAAPKKWLGDLVAAMAKKNPQEPWGLTEAEKVTLRTVGLTQSPMATRESFDQVIEWLKDSVTLPAIPCRIIKTGEWVGFIATQSIHPNSTSFKYGDFWFRNGRPDKLLWKKVWPKVDNRAGYLHFDPSVRKAGVNGAVEIEDTGSQFIFSGDRHQAKTYDDNTIPAHTYYDELLGGHRKPASYRQGPRVLSLPYEELVYDVGFGPDGVDVRWPEPGNGNGDGDDDCSEGNWFQRLWCRIKKFLGL